MKVKIFIILHDILRKRGSSIHSYPCNKNIAKNDVIYIIFMKFKWFSWNFFYTKVMTEIKNMQFLMMKRTQSLMHFKVMNAFQKFHSCKWLNSHESHAMNMMNISPKTSHENHSTLIKIISWKPFKYHHNHGMNLMIMTDIPSFHLMVLANSGGAASPGLRWKPRPPALRGAMR
jgi:hypothetical protein